jgi:hypothetical protein
MVLVDWERRSKLVQNPPGRLHDAEAVGIAGMVGAGVGQVGHAELADASEALEFGGVEQAKQECIGRTFHPKRDHIVNRVADDLLGHAVIRLLNLAPEGFLP